MIIMRRDNTSFETSFQKKDISHRLSYLASKRLGSTLLGLFICISGQLLHSETAVRCTPNGTHQMVCRIDEPVVNQLSTDYHQVIFHAGDQVTVDAGGCVQTGGSSATWKRYVNPSGPNSNKWYWGTISIPGATQGFVRISDILGKTLTVSPGLPDSQLYLRLGYIDNHYADNGYWGHDNGTENQCKGVGNAWVSLTINHPIPVLNSCAGSTGNAPMDMVWSDCDPNGFPMNPKWRWQVDHVGAAPLPETLCPSGWGNSCTTWPVTLNSADGWSGVVKNNPIHGCDGGHVNWFAATYEGPIIWDTKSTDGTDDDYNYWIFPPHDEGVTTPSNGIASGIEIEFDSDETIDHFTSNLLKEFRGLVDTNNDLAKTRIGSRTGVVTGLVGLDCGHESCSAELHPAYAMAVDMDDPNVADMRRVWAVFARNWGDEGFCSSGDLNPLPISDLKILIPWLPTATGVVVGPETQFYVFADSDSNAQVPSPQITYAVNQGILIDFSLPNPSAKIGIQGDLYLQWVSNSVVGSAITTGTMTQKRPTPHSEPDKPETLLGNAITRMTAPQREVFQKHVPMQSSTATIIRRPLALRPATQVAALPVPPHFSKPVAPLHSAPDPRAQQRREAFRQAICAAYDNAVPGVPSLCSSPGQPPR